MSESLYLSSTDIQEHFRSVNTRDVHSCQCLTITQIPGPSRRNNAGSTNIDADLCCLRELIC